jgi:predicted TIM-barrel fold metal-dependent hydrolase
LVEQLRVQKQTDQPLYETYRDLRVIDTHNHDAPRFKAALKDWDRYGIDRVVLFGSISEPAAEKTDRQALQAWQKYPERVIPFFAGVPVYDQTAPELARSRFEQGYLGIGEIVGASTNSPVASKLAWKAENPMAGYLPQIYAVAAEFGAPILMHIDPPQGEPIRKLEEALAANPETNIIFAHANAYNSPDNVAALLERHPNLYIDFFPGFTRYNPDSAYTLADFVPLIEEYPDRFVLSTDSGYGVGYKKAALAIYETLDLLTPEAVCKVAYQNIEKLIRQP